MQENAIQRNIRNTKQTLTKRGLLRIIHESLRTYNDEIEDIPLPDFNDWSYFQKDNGLLDFLFRNCDTFPITPGILHELWLEQMNRDGWKLGPNKDLNLKTHPNIVHWDGLDKAQQIKTLILYNLFVTFAPLVDQRLISLENRTGNNIIASEKTVNPKNIRNTRQSLTKCGLLRVIHETLRKFNEEITDIPLRKFEEAEPWQREIGMKCLDFLFENHAMSSVTPEIIHETWFQKMQEDGWTLGPEKDGGKKTHPNMVHWNGLDNAQKVKDIMFYNLFITFAPMVDEQRQADCL